MFQLSGFYSIIDLTGMCPTCRRYVYLGICAQLGKELRPVFDLVLLALPH